MAVPIEGFSVVAQKDRIKPFLDSGTVEAPNATALCDKEIWRCCFMEETDAVKFMETLSALGLNVSQGPDSDVVLVSELDRSVSPYCEWLVTGNWEKAVIAWKAGTRPDSVSAREGWDPKVGSGLVFYDRKSQDGLEFLRLQGNIEVYLNKETGKEVYLARTSAPVEALFKTAGKVITEHLVTAGEKPLSGDVAKQVSEAVKMLERVVAVCPDSWKVHWCLGKGEMALGDYEIAYQSLRRAYELERNAETVPRELAGVCLQLGKFDEAVDIAENATSLDPSNTGLIGNLALAYLLAGRTEEARRAISAALKIDGNDEINKLLFQFITEVAEGSRARPHSLAALSLTRTKPKKRFWQFWKQ
jgi:tetratricopeptide (TPR) repeat protein